MLAFIAATISWPIVTFASLAILQVLLMPLFNSLYRAPRGTAIKGDEGGPSTPIAAGFINAHTKASFWLADVFQSVVLLATQLLAVLAGKGIFAMFGCEATRWLGLPFGVWCLLFGLFGTFSGRMGRHMNLSWAVGLTIGWAVGTFALL